MSSRKDQKAKLRDERLAREREAAEAERRKRLVGYAVGGGLAAAAVIAIVVVILAGGGDSGGGNGAAPTNEGWPKGSVPEARIADLGEAAKAAGCTVEDTEEVGREHVSGAVTYKTNPPTSGDHRPTPADDGAYLQAPETEMLVHALEHGRIVIQFKPDAPANVRGNLKALFDEDPQHMILVPNQTGMPFQVAATAWTHSLGCPQYNDKVPDAIRALKTAYRDRGPEFVP